MDSRLTGTVFQALYDRWLHDLLRWYRDQNSGDWVAAVEQLGLHYTTVYRWVRDLETRGYGGLDMTTRSTTDAG